MKQNPFAPKYENLPETIAIFPLGSVLLLPHGELPLNIFEPRYLAMIDAAMASHKMIGMIQPDAKIGCAGKIIEYMETTDGRYLINLSGVARFRAREELSVTTPYRQVQAEWPWFEEDHARASDLDIDRSKLIGLLKAYFDLNGMHCDWDKVEKADDQGLITCLAMACPLDREDKQALLEALTAKERAALFEAMLKMNVQSGGQPFGSERH